jgi:hypothetical protein
METWKILENKKKNKMRIKITWKKNNKQTQPYLV